MHIVEMNKVDDTVFSGPGSGGNEAEGVTQDDSLARVAGGTAVAGWVEEVMITRENCHHLSSS